MAHINPLRRIYDWFAAQTFEHVLALGMLATGIFLAARPSPIALYMSEISGGLLTPVLFGMWFVVCGSAMYTAALLRVKLDDITLAALCVPYFVYCLSAWIVYVADMARVGNAPIGSITYTVLCALIMAYVRDR